MTDEQYPATTRDTPERPAVGKAGRGILRLLAAGPDVAGLGQGFVMAVPVLRGRAAR